MLDQDKIDELLLKMTVDFSRTTFSDGEIRAFGMTQDERDLLLAALNTLMSQRNQIKVSNRYWSNQTRAEPGNAAFGTAPGCGPTQAGGTQ